MAVHNPQRAVVGLCPDCERVIVITNDFEVWDLAECPCGWAGGTDAIKQYIRLEKGNISGIIDRTGYLLPPDREQL